MNSFLNVFTSDYFIIGAFVFSLLAYATIGIRDILYHYSLDGTPTQVPFGETILHHLAGSCVTTILVLLWFGNRLPISFELRKALLAFTPICLMVVGFVDEFLYHRPRCKNDPRENWHHAVLHFSMGSTLVLGYVQWY